HGLRLERRIECFVLERFVERRDQRGWRGRFEPRANIGGARYEMAHRERKGRIEAVERIGVVCREQHEIVVAEIGSKLDRRRETAIERGHRALLDSLELEGFIRGNDPQNISLETPPTL